jgi:hypothetical protein
MKNRWAIVCVLFAASLLAGRGADQERAAQVDDIREATFRYMFEHNGSSQPQKPKAYYLAIADGQRRYDPTESFMKRFTGHKPAVKRVSECTTWSATHGARDKKTGDDGLIARVGEIRWKGDKEVEVAGGYDEGPLSGLGYLYRLTKTNATWQVTGAIKIW